ncbi:MAG TPA: corrinoid protein [Gaiellaceae bacterium]
MSERVQAIAAAVAEGDAGAVKALVQEALNEQEDPAGVLDDGLIAGMREVGRLFEEGEYFVPEMLIAARAMKEGLAILRPALVRANVRPTGKVLIGTVKGDLHDIGKNLVGMMLEGSGLEVEDLGTDVSPERFVEAVRSGGAGLLGLSALLTTTMPYIRTTIEAIDEAGLRDRIKVIVGGAPVTEAFAREIGADGYAPDASRAAALARSLITPLGLHRSDYHAREGSP